MLGARAEWTNLALSGLLGGQRIWSPEYPQEILLRLKCRGCRGGSLGRVVFHDGTTQGAPQPVFLAEVQTVLINPSARPVEAGQSTIVLSPLDINLASIRAMLNDPNRRQPGDDEAQQELFEWLDEMDNTFPDRTMSLMADPAEQVQPVCTVSAHRPAATTAGQLLAEARSSRPILWL